MTDTPSGEMRKATKRAKTISLIAGLITAATPGVYGAWQAARASLKTQQEEVVRDKQEGDLQKNIVALQAQVEALQKSAVSQRDLVDLVLRLRASQPAPSRRPAAVAAAAARQAELERELTGLKKKAQTAAQATKQAAKAQKAAPRLKPAKQIRKLVRDANL